MTSSFRTAGAWGAGLGRPLTWAEQDNNTYDKEVRLLALENPATGEGPVGIASIELSGTNQLIITLTDGAVYTFELPSAAAWTPQGQWQPSSLYHANDVVYAMGGAYLVNVDHTSATSFDPNELSGTTPVYTLILPNITLPVLTITGATFTPDLSYANTYMRFTNGAGCAVTIASDAWEIGTIMEFRQVSSGSITFIADTGVTINPQAGDLYETGGQGSTAMLKNVATDEWDLMGRLALV